MTRRSWILVAALCGCGGKKSGGDEEVGIGYTSGAWGQLPLRFANSLGYLREAGVHVVLAELPGSSRVMQALLGGSVHVAATTMENVVQLAAEGRSAVGFVNQFAGPAFLLVVSPKATRRIRSLADLRGGTLGVSAMGSQTHLIANHLLDGQGRSPESVSTVSIGVGATSVAALERGMVDAGFVNYAGYVFLKRKYPDLTTLFDPMSSDAYRYPAAALCAKAEWLARNPDTARRIAGAVVRALRYIRQTVPEELVKQLPADLRSPDATADLQALRALIPLYSNDGTFPDDGFDVLKKIVGVSVAKVRTANIGRRDVFTNEFVREPK